MTPALARALLFDLEGTLWFQGLPPDRRRLQAEAARRIGPFLRRRGLVGRVDAISLVGDIWAAVEEALADPPRSLRQPQGSFIVQGAFGVLDIDLSPEEGTEVWSALHVPAEAAGWELYPDTLQVLSNLRERGLALAAVVNSPYSADLLRRDLATHGIGRFFDAVICSCEVGYLKPHAAPFERALRALCARPSDAAMVGDSLDEDVRPAHALGMTTVWKRNGRHGERVVPEATYVIDDLSEMLWLPFLPGWQEVRRPAESPTPHEDGNANRY